MINIFDEIKYFIQRGIKGYSDRDLWNLDLYLAKIICNGVKDFKIIQHGIPVEFWNKYKDRIDLSEKKKAKLAIKEFNNILDAISRGFKDVESMYEWQICPDKKHAIIRKNFYEAFKLLEQNFHNLND